MTVSGNLSLVPRNLSLVASSKLNSLSLIPKSLNLVKRLYNDNTSAEGARIMRIVATESDPGFATLRVIGPLPLIAILIPLVLSLAMGLQKATSAHRTNPVAVARALSAVPVPKQRGLQEQGPSF